MDSWFCMSRIYIVKVLLKYVQISVKNDFRFDLSFLHTYVCTLYCSVSTDVTHVVYVKLNCFLLFMPYKFLHTTCNITYLVTILWFPIYLYIQQGNFNIIYPFTKNKQFYLNPPLCQYILLCYKFEYLCASAIFMSNNYKRSFISSNCELIKKDLMAPCDHRHVTFLLVSVSLGDFTKLLQKSQLLKC